MRRIAVLVSLVVLGCVAAPAMASAATVAIEHASAHLRQDGRVELFVHARHARQARLSGHVHVEVLDQHGRVIAAGGDTRTVASGRDLRYQVILARSRSARVAAAMRRDGHLRLRVEHRGTITRAGVTTRTAAHAAAMDATVLDTDITISTHSGYNAALGLIIFGTTPYAGCVATPNQTTWTEHIVCSDANGDPGTLDVQLDPGPGINPATVLGGSFAGVTVTGGELTGSAALQQSAAGYALDVALWGSVTTNG